LRLPHIKAYLDCHNGPTHPFELPENGVDLRMSRGSINPELPYIHKKAVEMLKADYPNREVAGRHIVEGIEIYYRPTYPEVYNGKRALVEQSADNVPSGSDHRCW
jgi:hypothetical protein